MIAVSIMSHGSMIRNQLCVFFSCGAVIPLEEVIAPILECPELVNKPKLFFLQLCRGDTNVHQGLSADDAVHSIEENRYYHSTKDCC